MLSTCLLSSTLALVPAGWCPPQELPAGCATPPDVTVLQEDATSFLLLIDGGGLDESCSLSIDTGNQWDADLTLSLTDGVHDMLSLDGTLTHLAPPHAEGPNATPLPVALSIDAGTLEGGNHVVPFVVMVDHGSHRDVLEGSVTLEVFFEEIFDFHFIFDYSVVLQAAHTAAVPNLSVGWLLILAGAMTAFGTRRLARRRPRSGSS